MPARFEPRDARLRDGRSVRIRAIAASDEDAFLRAFEGLGDEARRLRFMRPVREANVANLRRAFVTLERDGLGLAALFPAPDGPDVVGSAIYVRAPDGASCEFAMSVVDAWTGAGLGGVLLGALVDAARDNGERVMEGFVLAENAAMRRLAARMGFEVAPHPGDPGLRVCRLDLRPAPPAG